MATPELQQTAASPAWRWPLAPSETVGGQGLEAERQRALRRLPAPTSARSASVQRRWPGRRHPRRRSRPRVGAPSAVDMVLASPGQPLPAAVRAIVEPRFGRRFDEVRIHTTTARRMRHGRWTRTPGPSAATSIRRRAVRSGSRRGLWLLSHELAHAIQQSGAPGPTSTRAGRLARCWRPRRGPRRGRGDGRSARALAASLARDPAPARHERRSSQRRRAGRAPRQRHPHPGEACTDG